MTANSPATDRELHERLSADIQGIARRVVIGLNWTLVESDTGAGLCHTPARGTAGCFGLPAPGDYTGQPLRALAALWLSENIFERAIGIAAVNAHWNRYDLEGGASNGLDLLEDKGVRTVIIGRFPGLETRLPGAAVIEREPGPDDYPEEAAPDLLANAEFVAITASTIANASLPGLLGMIRSAKTVLVGPSTPLAPALFDLGVHALSGFVAADLDGLVRTLQEGGGVKAMRRFGRFVTLERSVG
jgi:uncharacterized protein (DUF4213/DUF364 family)